jgi:hypothetical protein
VVGRFQVTLLPNPVTPAALATYLAETAVSGAGAQSCQ